MLLITFFFFNDTATTEIYTLSLHDALPISKVRSKRIAYVDTERGTDFYAQEVKDRQVHPAAFDFDALYTKSIDRKSTRLNSSHSQISYAVFCLKKKKEYAPIIYCIYPLGLS